MEKKAYQTPSLEVVKMSAECPMLDTSPIEKLDGDVFSGTINGSSEGARYNRRHGSWKAEW